jgi:hypothetical protein
MRAVLSILLLSASLVDAQTTQCDTCTPRSLRLLGTPNWLAGSTRDMRCLAKETAAVRKAAAALATDSMKETDAEGLDWMGRAWDLRTWTRASDGAVFYPYVFSKTLNHDPTTGMPLVADIKTVIDAVQCPSAASIGNIALSERSVRKLEGINNCQVRSRLGGVWRLARPPYHEVRRVLTRGAVPPLRHPPLPPSPSDA